ncbi:SDR family NAD(P)-dependent oxidoreductase [Streptomyces acidicola]|uniref:SDR family NAD(P)-dependent oxidoreductase n=1 Tax=Streptomyces acidicola TaxID=2596892 RepID=UPI0037925EBD
MNRTASWSPPWTLAGAVGVAFCVAYSAAKFGVEGSMESLHHDVEPFGIHTTIVEPGFFRAELLEDAGLEQPPLRFVEGDGCLEAVEAKARQLLAQVDASRELGSNLAHGNAS